MIQRHKYNNMKDVNLRNFVYKKKNCLNKFYNRKGCFVIFFQMDIRVPQRISFEYSALKYALIFNEGDSD